MKKSKDDLFTNTDYAIVRSAVRRLPGLLGIVIELRFWKKCTLDEIAVELGVSTRSIESAFTRALRMLREECLRHPSFSRSEYETIQWFRSQNAA